MKPLREIALNWLAMQGSMFRDITSKFIFISSGSSFNDSSLSFNKPLVTDYIK
jgi:hypothetical protein